MKWIFAISAGVMCLSPAADAEGTVRISRNATRCEVSKNREVFEKKPLRIHTKSLPRHVMDKWHEVWIPIQKQKKALAVFMNAGFEGKARARRCLEYLDQRHLAEYPGYCRDIETKSREFEKRVEDALKKTAALQGVKLANDWTLQVRPPQGMSTVITQSRCRDELASKGFGDPDFRVAYGKMLLKELKEFGVEQWLASYSVLAYADVLEARLNTVIQTWLKSTKGISLEEWPLDGLKNRVKDSVGAMLDERQKGFTAKPEVASNLILGLDYFFESRGGACLGALMESRSQHGPAEYSGTIVRQTLFDPGKEMQKRLGVRSDLSSWPDAAFFARLDVLFPLLSEKPGMPIPFSANDSAALKQVKMRLFELRQILDSAGSEWLSGLSGKQRTETYCSECLAKIANLVERVNQLDKDSLTQLLGWVRQSNDPVIRRFAVETHKGWKLSFSHHCPRWI